MLYSSHNIYKDYSLHNLNYLYLKNVFFFMFIYRDIIDKSRHNHNIIQGLIVLLVLLLQNLELILIDFIFYLSFEKCLLL